MGEQARVDVVIGTGGVGTAVARRLHASAGDGDRLVVADVREDDARALAVSLGEDVVAARVDVADRDSVRALVDVVAGHGQLGRVAHTAGVSPARAPVRHILEIDLIGTVHVVEELGRLATAGSSAVVVASTAGHLFAHLLDDEAQQRLASAPADELLEIERIARVRDTATAYGLAKRANQLRVRAAAHPWGRRGARLNSVSPELVDTDMGRAELASENGALVRALVESSALGRAVTADEVARAVLSCSDPTRASSPAPTWSSTAARCPSSTEASRCVSETAPSSVLSGAPRGT